MKSAMILSAFLLAGVAIDATAACTTGNRLENTDLNALIPNSLVCGRPGTNYPGDASDRWQEEHLVGGVLYDYKLGDGHPVDPRKQVGTWSISGKKVIHTYGAYSYSWTVQPISGNTYRFCKEDTNEEHVVAFIGPNTGSGCGGSFPP